MQHTLVVDTEGLRASLTGRFTFQDYPDFRRLLNAIEATTGRRVAVDLEALEFIDSAALGMLLIANDACKKAGLSFLVQHPKGQVYRTLEIAAMGSIFQIQQ